MGRRAYTPEQRTQALELYRTDGPTKASEATGIPKGTIAAWAHDEGVQTDCLAKTANATRAAALRWEERRTELAHRMGEIASKALERVDHAIEGQDPFGGDLYVPGAFGQPTLIHPSDAKALATTCAILVDKAQLLTGAATSRHEHTSGLDAEIERLTRELELSGPT
jgi:hypothetical protein